MAGITGKWTNQNGSTLIIDDVQGGKLSGRFESSKGRAAKGIEYPFVGLQNGELISFIVSFDSEDGNLCSMTSFSGRLQVDSDGIQQLHTTWILSRQFEDAERTKPTQTWNTFMVNSDIFVQMTTDA